MALRTRPTHSRTSRWMGLTRSQSVWSVCEISLSLRPFLHLDKISLLRDFVKTVCLSITECLSLSLYLCICVCREEQQQKQQQQQRGGDGWIESAETSSSSSSCVSLHLTSSVSLEIWHSSFFFSRWWRKSERRWPKSLPSSFAYPTLLRPSVNQA